MRTHHGCRAGASVLEALERRLACDATSVHTTIGADGEVLLFIERGSSPVAIVDVAEVSGGPRAIGPLVAWVDHHTGLVRGAAATTRGLTIYREHSSGAWGHVVLSERLGTQTQVRPDIALTVGPGGRINIVGVSADGDLIRYVQSGEGPIGWSEWNISENQLAWRGLATPDFIGSITALSTSWGGLNIAGIDAKGDLVTVWTSLTAGRWYVSNLSDHAGIGPLWSGLDSVSAGRGGIHFSTVNGAGKVTIVSWKPGSAGWSASTLDSSPTMQQGEIAMAFDPRSRSLVVTTLRLDTGALILHRLPLEFAPPTPQWTTVSGFGVPVERRVRDWLSVTIGTDGVVGVFGNNPEEETVRFTASDPLATEWNFENLTDMA